MFRFLKRALNLRKFARWTFESDSSDSMARDSRDRFFSNPFPDFTPESAHELVESLKVQKNQKFLARVNERWKAVEDKFQYMDQHDYSVYTGTAGLALLKLKRNPNDAENLKVIPLKFIVRLTFLQMRY